jgi:hypothetical protein
MATDFELTVLDKLSEIHALCATNTQAHKDIDRRVCGIEEKQTRDDWRHWVSAVILAPIMLSGHALARHLGWDV